MGLFAFVGAIASVVSMAPADAFRTTVSLNGEWTMQFAGTLEDTIGGAWEPTAVPGVVSGVDGRCAWFRTVFVVPAEMRGRRIALWFGGVKYNSRVIVNGQHVGGEFNGYDPFEVEVTQAVRVGAENELLLGCHDWQGIFTEPYDLSRVAGDWDAMRVAPHDRILSPIGGLYTEFGPWDDVELRALPLVRVDRVAITTSVREMRITAEYTLANDGDTDRELSVEAAVVDGEESALALPSGQARVPAGGKASVTLECPWPAPRLWSHEDPYLYLLRTRLVSSGEVVDLLDTRFGFREFWIEGPDFYLNGSKMYCLASSGWPMHSIRDREAVRELWEGVKAANCNTFRTHTQPWRRMFYEVADEVGLLMIPEGAVWNDDDSYRINDPAFWDNYATHLRRMSEQYRNNPSVVMYSLENEMYGGRMNERNAYAMEQLANLGLMMKELDPTRPITYESDGDPLGVADVFGLHYPHEYPDHTQYPDTCWWFEQGTLGVGMFAPLDADGRWRWKRDKPLYIGEFLWVPATDPSGSTVFFGDAAYTDHWRFHMLAKAASWKMQIEAYRDLEVSGICPWTMVEGGPLDESNPLFVAQRDAYRPIAAFPREYNTRFYGGDLVKRRLTLHNDVLAPSDLTLRWALSKPNNRTAQGEQRIVLAPGERAETVVEFRVPEVAERTPLQFQVQLLRDGVVCFSDEHAYTAEPRTPVQVPDVVPVCVYDPAHALDELIDGRVTRIGSLAELPEPPAVLLVGPLALTAPSDDLQRIGPAADGSEGIARWVLRGGRAVVLRQSVTPAFVGGTTPSGHASTMAFAQMPDHPVLRDVVASDLKWWAARSSEALEHLVSTAEPIRPTAGAFRAVVTTGSGLGLAHAPVLELPSGEGTVLLCQMLVAEKAAVEPAAVRLLQNMLDYAAQFRPAMRPTALVCGDESVAEALRRAGVVATDARDGRDLSGMELLICSGELRDRAGVAAALERGATVVLHRPEPGDFSELAGHAAGLWRLVRGGAILTRKVDGPLAQHIAHEDLYWLGARTGSYFSPTPLTTDVVDRYLVPSMEGLDGTSYGAESMRYSGGIARLEDDGWIGLYTTGDASVDVDFGDGGMFIVGGRLGGTPALGQWPICRVAIDGVAVGSVTITRGEFADYGVLADVGPGRHEVTLSFTNDASGPGEDRNLLVQAVLVAPVDAGDSRVDLITRPGALAVLPVGNGRLVLDCVRWDAPGANATKAARYLCSLMTALGAEFTSRSSSAIEAERLELDPGVPFASTEGPALHFGSAGAASGSVRVTRAGEYDIELVGWGTRAAGVYPIVEVSLDGEVLGEVSIASDHAAAHPLGRVNLSAGVHTLRLRFTNDLYEPPEDRNVWIDRVVAYWDR